MCGKAEAAVNPESACKSRQMCVNAISGCLKVKISYSWVTQGNFPEPFLSLPCTQTRKKLLVLSENSW